MYTEKEACVVRGFTVYNKTVLISFYHNFLKQIIIAIYIL